MTDSWIAKQADLCGNVRVLRDKYAIAPDEHAINADAIIGALNHFQECVRYLRTRRSTGAILNLNSEADVQDAVFLMLRLWVHDLNSENPTDRIANRYSIKDFISPSAETVIEVKYVRDPHHGKQLSSELHDDIENYRHHPNCGVLVFFVYDPNSLIPDQAALQRQIEEPRAYSGKNLRCVLIVKP